MSKYTPGCELCSGSGGGGASDFVSLTDTPSSYAGSDGYLLSVSGSEVVFTPNTATGSGGQVEIIDNATTSDLNVNSTTSWVTLQAGSVTTTTTGDHYVSLEFMYLINAYSSIVNFKFKVEFDDGVNPVIVAGDTPKWRYRAGGNTSYLLGNFQDSVSLTKDTTYTVTAYVAQEASVSTNFLMPNSNGVGKTPTISIVAPGSGGSGGGGTASPLTNKGDLYTFSTDNTRLPSGSDGQMLAVDSAEATGLKWVDGVLQESVTPTMAWSSSTLVNISAAPGEPSLVRKVLQDGTPRSFTGTITFNPSLGATDGGLDTGTEAVSTWYYIYLVPSSGDDSVLVARGSANDPDTGPVGYTNFKYIGAVRNDASSNIKEFGQLGNEFWIWPAIAVYAVVADSPFALTALDISTAVPTTARNYTAQLKLGASAAGEVYLYWLSPTSTTKVFKSIQNQITTSGLTLQESSIVIFTPQVIYHQLERIAGTGTVGYVEHQIAGWRDPYVK